jgi:hypothetical protein
MKSEDLKIANQALYHPTPDVYKILIKMIDTGKCPEVIRKTPPSPDCAMSPA